MNRSLSRVHTVVRTFLIVAFSACGFGLTAQAQGFRGGPPPSPEESFRRMDRNQNGQIDPDGKVVFGTLDELRPGATVTFTVEVEAVKPGDARFRAEVRAAHLTSPLKEEQATRVVGGR